MKHLKLKDNGRFWFKVNKTETCWLWTGSTNSRGYGEIYWKGRKRRATQVSIEIHTGKPFPKGKMACHKCDNPPCVRPDHLWAGTMSENIIDSYTKGRSNNKRKYVGHNSSKSSCKRGHEFTTENTIITSQGRRSCRICQRVHQNVYDKKRRAKADRLRDGG